MTIGDIAIVLAFVAGVLTSILVIWSFSSKVKTAHDENIKNIVDATLENNDKVIDKKIDYAVNCSQGEIRADIKDLSRQLRDYIDFQKETNKKDYESIKLLKESLIEAYKQDIRSIYYRLRQTGEITDTDKSYVDKLFPKYIALGGNSDIQAKYEEMCRVYETITQENFEKARQKYLRDKIKREEAVDKKKENNKQ